MGDDSICGQPAQEAGSIKGASGSKRDGDFCDSDSDSVTKKMKTNIEGNQNPELSVTHRAKNGEDTKSSPQISNTELSYSIEADAAEDKGSRHTMEDAWVVLRDASLDFPGALRCAYFAIFDGHGGRLAAEYVQKNLHRNVLLAGLPLGFEGSKKGNT